MKIKVSLKPERNNVYFTWRPIYISDHISLSSSYNEKCFTQNRRKNQNKRFVFNKVFFFFKSWCLRDNVKDTVQLDRPRMTMWLLRIACWITKSTRTHTHTHKQYVILLLFHCNKGYANGPKFYLLLTLPALFKLPMGQKISSVSSIVVSQSNNNRPSAGLRLRIGNRSVK